MVEAVVLEEVSEAVPIPAAIHPVYHTQFLEAASQGGDPEGEVVGLRMSLVGAAGVEVEAGA